MKFEDFPYEHQELSYYQDEFSRLERELSQAEDYETFLELFREADRLRRKLDTNVQLCSIRHTIDTRDPYYKQEDDYYSDILPILQEEIVKFKNTVLNSKFAQQLRNDIPQIWFDLAKQDAAMFLPVLVEDMQIDNKLAAEYQSLVASAQIDFNGKTYTLEGLGALMNDSNREIRKEATKAYWNWFAEHEKEIGDIFDRMVKVRTRMAKKLGFENFIPLGYMRMNRLDYDQNDVENYRRQVLEDIVPLDNELYERQRKRLGLDQLHCWDEKVEFKSGSPKPVLSTDKIIETSRTMFEEMDPETGEFFNSLADSGCLDLDAKPGKAAGGYCTAIADFETPFIFSNFSGTASDIETLTHESGHAFQSYESMDLFPIECTFPTMESCEIHSMSMEFFCYPWIPLFFRDQADKYYFKHLSGTVKFLPYGILVDHFQHKIYENPEMSHEERMAAWRELEKMYLPHKNYEEIDVLERGGWWMRQLHIFLNPFYYIDYTLAQVCALQFWNRIQKEDPQAFEDYKKICKIGGTLPFRQIVKEAGLNVPFEDGCLKETAAAVKDWFAKQDDSQY